MSAFAKSFALICGVSALAGPALAAGSDMMTYAFTTSAYEQVFDSPQTALRYNAGMNIQMSVTLDAPLSPNLSGAPITPMAWSYDDGNYSEDGTEAARFNGLVSTDASGQITGFMMQVYLNAPLTPGVWVRRDTSGDAYATAFAQEIVSGLLDPCWRHSSCGTLPQTSWVQDRASGTGDIYVSTFATDDPSAGSQSVGVGIGNAAAVVPLPAPLALLGAGLAGLLGLRRGIISR